MSETDAIDEQLRKPETGVRYERTQANGDGMHKRILEALIVASIISLIAVVWNLTQTVTLHQASIDSLRRDMDRSERKQDMLEGKITRGGPDAAADQ